MSEGAGQRTPGGPLRAAAELLALASVAGLALLVGYRCSHPPEWEYSVEAVTEAVEIALEPDAQTRWRIDGAVVCTRSPLEGGDALVHVGAREACGSRAWHAQRVDEPELVLTLDGDVRAGIEVRSDDSLAMSLRRAGGGALGSLATSAGSLDVRLRSPVNLSWPAASPDGDDRPPLEVLLPFAGRTTIGRDVNWAGARLLRHGRIAVYTADPSADRRTRIDESELLLGDQVRLGSLDARDGGARAKGFVQWAPGSGEPLHVVAFGRARGLAIERFGDKGYGFSPGRWELIWNDPTVAGVTAVLVGILGLAGSLLTVERLAVADRVASWLRSRRGGTDGSAAKSE